MSLTPTQAVGAAAGYIDGLAEAADKMAEMGVPLESTSTAISGIIATI